MTDQKPTISLAQWCAYLPHDIEVQIEGKNYKLVSDNSYGASLSDAIRYSAKPLLRPMNKENEVDIDEIISFTYNHTIDYNAGGDSDSDIGFRKEGDNILLDMLPYCIVQALLAAHYDIFNLIPQGLALPIE